MDDRRDASRVGAPGLPPRTTAAAAVVGGLLWPAYGLLTMLQPWGADVVYQEALGYSVVVDKGLFVAYSLPGAVALMLTSVGLLGVVAAMRRRAAKSGRIARLLAAAALLLGALALLGVIFMFDPVFTAGRIMGTLVLGIAAGAAAATARTTDLDRTLVAALLVLGALGVFLLPLWPLVYALEWVTPGQAVWLFALFGVGWAVIGWLMSTAGEPGRNRRQDRDPPPA